MSDDQARALFRVREDEAKFEFKEAYEQWVTLSHRRAPYADLAAAWEKYTKARDEWVLKAPPMRRYIID